MNQIYPCKNVRPLAGRLLVCLLAAVLASCNRAADSDAPRGSTIVGTPEPFDLKDPRLSSDRSLEALLAARRSVRDFTDEPISDEHLAQLVWAAQGVTAPDGGRTAPSAGALYPLNIYTVSDTGLCYYDADEHKQLRYHAKDLRRPLYKAALSQDAVLHAPVVFVITAVYQRTAGKYGAERARRFGDMEAGHAAQNLLLQAGALDLAAVPIGGFEDDDVSRVLGLSPAESPLYIIPVGHPK